MSLGLNTVQDYVTAARVLLMDQVEPYRYADLDLVMYLNQAMYAARKVRYDLFLGNPLVVFTALDTTAVSIDIQYRDAFVLFLVGMAELRDDETTQDARAAGLLQTFSSKLVGMN